MTSEAEHLTAVLAAVNAANGSAHSLDELAAMATRPAYYNEVTVTRRLGDTVDRMGSRSQVTLWRVLVRSVAQQYGNAQEMRRRAALALDDVTLTIGGEPVFVARTLSDDPIGPDDGWWSGVSEYGYAL